ncbi:MAG: D-alanine--D-alanine ligase [Rhizomicrobium sp.]
MRIGVTYDLRSEYLAMGYGEEETAEFDSEVTVAAICAALQALGYEPVRIGGVRRLADRLVAGERWDAVFNICEGLKGVAREAQVPALLDAYDVPYVFSDPLTLSLALDKSMAKLVVRACGVPTPDFALIRHGDDVARIVLPFPLFAKPVAEGSGKGVDAKSRAENRSELARVADDLLVRFRQPVLVESFLSGREFTVGITGTGQAAQVLGVLEVIWRDQAIAHGYGYENKEHFEDRMIYRLTEDEAAAGAAEVALAAWRALRCRDGGRVDIRYGDDGRAYFLEVNPLAGLHPDRSDLVFIARFKGLTYRDLIGRIMQSFAVRHHELRAHGEVA